MQDHYDNPAQTSFYFLNIVLFMSYLLRMSVVVALTCE